MPRHNFFGSGVKMSKTGNSVSVYQHAYWILYGQAEQKALNYQTNLKDSSN